MQRPASPFLVTLIATLILCACATAGAQPPAPGAALLKPPAGVQDPPAPSPGSSPLTTGGPGSAAPASTVSPAIERFMQQNARRLAAPEMTDPSRIARQLPSPLPPPRPPGNDTPGRQAGSEPSPDNPLGLAPGQGLEEGNPMRMEPSPLDADMAVRSAPFRATDFRFPLNLAGALRLSDARPLIVAAAQASVWVAEAELTRSKLLWVPNINFAADYIRHDGGGPDFNKGILTAVSTNFFYGGGALYGYIYTADAIFQPFVARQMLNARHWDVQTAKNDALLQTADAYFLVHQHRGTYAGSLYCVKRGRELVEQLKTLSRDLISEFEVQRAQNLLADLEQRAISQRQRWRVRSADLTQVLRLDPRAVVDPLEQDHLQITLIDPAHSLEDLMMVAIANRPELASRRASVGAATSAVRREKARMILPNIYLTGFQSSGGMLIQAGIFGLGPNSSLNQFVGRDDVSVQLLWQLEGIGLGNLARIKRQRGRQSLEITALYAAQDNVAADVTRALARVQSASTRVLQADRALRSGIITYNGQVEGLKQTNRFGNVLVLVNRPQETVYALRLLNTAFDEYFATVAEYNRAQFDLFHSLGYPAREVSTVRPPGEDRPIDTSRPSFLPPVGNGAPPATR